MAQVFSALCHIDHSADALGRFIGDIFFFHQAAAAQKDSLPLQSVGNAETTQFLIVFRLGQFLFIGRCNRLGDGMIAHGFTDGRQPQHVTLFFRHGKLPLRQGASLIKHHLFQLAEGVQVLAALDEDAPGGGCTDAGEITQGDRQHQGTGAGYHQKYQRPAKPHGKRTKAKEGRENCHQHRQQAHHGGIDAGKAGDEFFCSGFFRRGMLHHFQNFHDRGLAKGLFHTNFQIAIHIDATAENGIALSGASGEGFPRQGRRIQHGMAFFDDAVQRDALPGPYQNAVTYGNQLRGNLLCFSPYQQPGKIRADIQKGCDGFSGAGHGILLKGLPHLIKQHNKNRLRHFPDGQCADGGNRHQEIFIKHLAPGNIFPRPQQNIIAEHQISRQKQRRLCDAFS